MVSMRRINATRWWKFLIAAFVALIGAAAAFCVVVLLVQDGMFFYPNDDPESREYLLGIPGYRKVEFTAQNGKTYHGMLYRPNGDVPSPLVVYFGGNGECSGRNLRISEKRGEWQYFAGYSYLFVDYEGYGLNGGQASYLNMYEEALAVYDWAAALPEVDVERIVAMGYSIGTGCAVYLAANRPVAGLVLAAPYANGYDLYNSTFPVFFGPLKVLAKHKLPSDEYAPKVTCPVLVIASRNDEAVPFGSSERLSKLFKLSSGVDFMPVDGATHNGLFGAEGVFGKIQAFLEGL